MTNDNLQALTDAGVSIWLDDLSRDRLDSGNLAELVKVRNVTGVTTNPTIFQLAMSKGNAYDDQLEKLAAAGKTVEEAIFAMTTDDVRNACDVLHPVYEATGGVDGRVSIEVDPRLAHDADKTVAEAKALRDAVDRENALIKIPATLEGIPAITATMAEGISVNVTLIFSLERYRAVMNAFLSGLEQAKEKNKRVSTIASVASFFVSRVDTEVDKRLDAIGTDEAKALKGKAGIANARLAYQAYEEVFSSERWKTLLTEEAKPQRPLWASTGVKDPAYPDTMYVDQLVARGVVNTMPEKTLDAVADHGDITGDTITGNYADAQKVLDDLEQLGIAYNDVVDVLEREGVEKFEKSWGELLDEATANLEKAAQKAAQK
jgi:transaldolase